MTSTLDQLVEEYVSQGVKWENLPEYVRNQLGNSQEVYVQEIKNYCMNHLTSFENSLAKHFMNKNGYYTDMINYLRSHLRVRSFLPSNNFSTRPFPTNSQTLLSMN